MSREKALRVLISSVLLCCSYVGFTQGTSNQGKEFWTAFMSHIDAPGQQPGMLLYITADQNTAGKLEVADNSFTAIPFNVVAGQVTEVVVPKEVFLKQQGKALKGLHITAEKNIAVYAHIYAESVSGATLLLPVSVLGKSYYSINYTQRANVANAYSTFMVVATEDNTKVEITPSQDLLANAGPAGVMFSVTLQKGEVYQGLSNSDLTNTKIRSVSSVNGECKKIAVFSGSTKIGIGCQDDSPNHFTSDNLFQQVYPTSSWGENYITVPLKSRNYDIFRVVFSDPDTKLFINGQEIPKPSYQTSYYYQFESQSTNYITADKPVQVVQYAVTQGKLPGDVCGFDINDVGDPEMIYLNPLEQTLDHVTLYSPENARILNSYVNVVIKTDKKSTFRVDGAPYANFFPVANNATYSYAQVPLSTGAQHTLNASDGFTAIAYGFGSAESYGYSAGTNLKNLNENIVLAPLQGADTYTDGCTGEPYKLRLSLPFEPTKIFWNLKGSGANYTDLHPVRSGTAPGSNGQTIYMYEYNIALPFLAGDHTITATATNPVAGECGDEVDVDFDFNIGEKPQTNFTPDGLLCSANAAAIIDQSTGDISRVKIWWDYQGHPDDFDDIPKNMIPADRKYYHQYEKLTTDKDYIVHMETFAGTASQCESGDQNNITVHGTPNATFDAVDPMCVDAGKVQLMPHHDGFSGPDGVFSGTGVSASGEFNPAVSGPGTFPIIYTFTATNGCPVAFPGTITVNPLPVVNAGGYMEALEGEGTRIPATANAGAGAQYSWEPATGLDNPTVLNPVFMGSSETPTPYRLTVTTAAGCIAFSDITIKVLKKLIVVNAFTPNGDGTNDTWIIKYLDTYPGNTVNIYNRQGQKVYSSVGYAIPWDGRSNGNILPTGTYYYIINPKNGRKVIAGSVTIIK